MTFGTSLRLPSLALALSLALGCGQQGQTSPGDGGDADDSGTSGGTTASDGGSGPTGGPGGTGATGGSGATGAGAAPSEYQIDPKTSWHQPDLSASLRFSPTDDLEEHILGELGKATQSIRLAFFNVRLDEVRDLLVAKDAAGVDVHVVLDKKQQDLDYNTMGDELAAAGVPVTLVDNAAATQATMHDKFAVVDGHLVMTGSANYSVTAMHVSDEDLLTIDSQDLAARYLDEFDELVAGGSAESPPSAAAVSAWMGPEDGLAYRVAAEIDAAKTHVLVAMFEINTQSLVDALIAAHDRGVTVVVVLDEVQATDVDADADAALAAAGIPVVLAHNTGGMFAEMHSKLCVVDHERVMMGSFNWTNLGAFYNDENLVVIDDSHLAARAEGKLAELLQEYAAASPAGLGLTTGKQQVSFEVENVSLEAGVKLTIESIDGGPFAAPVDLSADGAVQSVSASVDAGTRVRYRYRIEDAGGLLVAEPGEHAFVVPYSPGPFLVRDAFVP